MFDDIDKQVSTFASIAAGLAGIWAGFKFVATPIIGVIKRGAWLYKRAVQIGQGLEQEFGDNPGAQIKSILQRINYQASLAELQREIITRHLDVGVYVCDPTGRCTYANPQLCDLFGLSADKMKGFSWMSSIIDEDRAACYAAWLDSVDHKYPYSHSYRIRNAMTGKLYSCTTRAYSSSVDDVVIGFVGFVKATEIKDSPI